MKKNKMHFVTTMSVLVALVTGSVASTVNHPGSNRVQAAIYREIPKNMDLDNYFAAKQIRSW